MFHSSVFRLAFFSFLMLPVGHLGAQQTILVPDAPSCAECLELELVLSFGSVDDEGALMTRNPVITRIPDDSWVVFESPVGGLTRIYDPDGTYRRSVDADGEGPGEYRGLSRLLPGCTDGFTLYDVTSARLSRVDSDFSFLSSAPFLSALRIEALSGGAFVVNALLPSSAAQGHVVNVVDSVGNVLASFGGSGGPIDFRVFHARHRVIAVDEEDRIWTGYPEKFELQKFGRTGRPILRISRIAEWFTPHSNILPPKDINSDPPNPLLHDLTVDPGGIVWVVVWVADPDWREAVSPEFDPRTTTFNDQVYDSVLEAIDPVSGRVLARVRTDHLLRKVHVVGSESRAPLFYRSIQQENGFIRADVFRATVRKHPE